MISYDLFLRPKDAAGLLSPKVRFPQWFPHTDSISKPLLLPWVKPWFPKFTLDVMLCSRYIFKKISQHQLSLKNGFPWFCFSLFPNFGCWKLILYWLTPSKTRCSWCDPIFGRLKIIFFWCVYPTIMRLENSQVVAPIGSLAALAQLTTPNPFTIDKPIHNWILGRSSQDHPTYIYIYIPGTQMTPLLDG